MSVKFLCQRKACLLLALALGITLVVCSLAAETTTPSVDLPGSQVEIKLLINEERTLESDMAYIVVPGEEVRIKAIMELPEQGEMAITHLVENVRVSSETDYDWQSSGGKILQCTGKSLLWQAPAEPGDYQVVLNFTEKRKVSGNPVSQKEPWAESKLHSGKCILTVLVQYLFDRRGRGILEGYPIGIYPNEEGPGVSSHVAKNREQYRPPTHFVKVTSENETLLISRHFRLADFSVAEEKGKVRFIALKYPVIDRLEQIISGLHKKGIKARGLKVIRGFLSPNEIQRMRGKGVSLSQFTRYQYGDAAAIIVDEDGNNKMDDLNNDGAINVKDARVLADVVEEIERKTGLPGGLGVYWKYEDPLLPDTPYIQVDMRGIRSRWSHVVLPPES